MYTHLLLFNFPKQTTRPKWYKLVINDQSNNIIKAVSKTFLKIPKR